MTRGDLTLYLTASLRKALNLSGFGVPVRFLQQEPNDDTKIEDEVQILSSISFPARGTRSEDYALMDVEALVRTKLVPTDVYYHTRVKARVVEGLSKYIHVYRIGAEGLDKAKVGVLRPLPQTTLFLEPASVDSPNASVVRATFEYQPC